MGAIPNIMVDHHFLKLKLVISLGIPVPPSGPAGSRRMRTKSRAAFAPGNPNADVPENLAGNSPIFFQILSCLSQKLWSGPANPAGARPLLHWGGGRPGFSFGSGGWHGKSMKISDLIVPPSWVMKIDFGWFWSLYLTLTSKNRSSKMVGPFQKPIPDDLFELPKHG